MTWCQWPGYLLGNEAITNYGCRMFGGLWITLQLVGISVGLGVILGFLVALVRLYGGPVSSRIALGYTTFFRGTPLLCQLFLVYYGAGQFRPALEAVGLWVYFRDAFFCAAFTFTINTAATRPRSSAAPSLPCTGGSGKPPRRWGCASARSCAP